MVGKIFREFSELYATGAAAPDLLATDTLAVILFCVIITPLWALSQRQYSVNKGGEDESTGIDGMEYWL